MTFQENSKPIYLQIVDRLSDAIKSGQYQSEQRMPSVRESASNFQVNANTMMRAYDFLAQRGIIYNKRGIGFYVESEALSKIKELERDTFFNTEIYYFFDRLQNMRITPQQLQALYESYINSSDPS